MFACNPTARLPFDRKIPLLLLPSTHTSKIAVHSALVLLRPPALPPSPPARLRAIRLPHRPPQRSKHINYPATMRLKITPCGRGTTRYTLTPILRDPPRQSPPPIPIISTPSTTPCCATPRPPPAKQPSSKQPSSKQPCTKPKPAPPRGQRELIISRINHDLAKSNAYWCVELHEWRVWKEGGRSLGDMERADAEREEGCSVVKKVRSVFGLGDAEEEEGCSAAKGVRVVKKVLGLARGEEGRSEKLKRCIGEPRGLRRAAVAGGWGS